MSELDSIDWDAWRAEILWSQWAVQVEAEGFAIPDHPELAGVSHEARALAAILDGCTDERGILVGDPLEVTCDRLGWPSAPYMRAVLVDEWLRPHLDELRAIGVVVLVDGGAVVRVPR